MAAAVGNSVGYQNDNRAEESRNYQNCVVASSGHPLYENCVFSDSNNATVLAQEESRHLPSTLPAATDRRYKHNTRYRYSDLPTSNFSSQPEVVGESNQILPEDETIPKRLVSTQKRSSFRLKNLAKKSMGSGSSVMKETNDGKSGKKITKNKHHLNADSNSDNGGFEPGTPKPSLGVKEKLRHSLDKINLKNTFRWSSSDKLSSNARGSKSKSKNNRRLVGSELGLGS